MLACAAMLAHAPLIAQTITPLQGFVLGAVQGLTELLPVSSSAHLYIVPTLLGWKYEGVAFDVALHGGTLVALVIAFAKDWLALIRGLFDPGEHGRETRGIWIMLIVATIPGAIAGKLLDAYADTHLRFLPLQACMLAVFGFLLWAVDRASGPGRDWRSPGWPAALAMGLSQCLALIPGVSRSGVTMTAARGIGLSRVSAARFSFLLATPITMGALVLKLPHMPHDVPPRTMLIGVAAAAVFGVAAIQLLLRMMRSTGFGWFFAYRAALAAFILVFWIGHRG